MENAGCQKCDVYYENNLFLAKGKFNGVKQAVI